MSVMNSLLYQPHPRIHNHNILLLSTDNSFDDHDDSVKYGNRLIMHL